MATIKVTITVGKLSNVLSLFDEIKVYRSVAGEAGPYSEITGPGTRITLVAGQTVYVYDDTAGDAAYYYKTSYYNSVSTLESSLSDPIKGDASTLYVDVDDIRAEGITVAIADDDRVLELITTWQQYIERLTRQWFRPRELTWDSDGNGTTLLQLPVPIISVSALYVNGDFADALDADLYEVYNGRGDDGRDDRKNPRIKLVTGDTSIFTGTGPVRRRWTVFEIGEKNQRVEGTFGYVEPDGSVPGPIQYALKKLVVRTARPLGGSSGGGSGPAGPMIEEETDRHRRKWSDAVIANKMWSTTGTGDAEIDTILAAYKAPLSMRAPRTMYRRLTGGTVI